jgi:hypothetical protein
LKVNTKCLDYALSVLTRGAGRQIVDRAAAGVRPDAVLRPAAARPARHGSAARPAPLPRRPAATACRRPGLLHPLGRMLCSGRTGPARPAAPSPGLTAIRPGLPQAPPYAAPGCGSAHGSGCCWGAPGCCAQAGPARLRCSPRCPRGGPPLFLAIPFKLLLSRVCSSTQTAPNLFPDDS